jgi:2-oxoglutarate dehydrogenase E1 component
MGALSFLQMNLEDFQMKYISRPASASTATGFAKRHTIEQNELINKAFEF